MDRKKYIFFKYLEYFGKSDLKKFCERCFKWNFKEIKVEK